MLVKSPWFLPVLMPLETMKSYFMTRAIWFWASIGGNLLGPHAESEVRPGEMVELTVLPLQ